MNDRKMTFVIDRLQRAESRMQRKESIQINRPLISQA